MQFISDRESLAQQFAYQTQKDSSYLLSSRASRRRIVYEQSIDAAQQQINDFKQQIQERYLSSIINKIYTFPFSYDSIDMFDDTQFKELQGVVQINLYNEEQQKDKGKFKIMNKKIKNQKVNHILQQIKLMKENVINRTLCNQEQLYESTYTKRNTVNNQASKSKQKSIQKSGRNRPPNAKKYDQYDQDENHIKKRLNTEPYEKPLGFIVKKR